MEFDEIYSTAEELGAKALEKAVKVWPEQLGLDSRCGQLFIDSRPARGYVACLASQDKFLRHYGGFQYVEDIYRLELPGVVFYSAEAKRVCGAIEEYSK